MSFFKRFVSSDEFEKVHSAWDFADSIEEASEESESRGTLWCFCLNPYCARHSGEVQVETCCRVGRVEY